MIAASLIETICAAVRASRKWPSPASGPTFAGSAASDTSRAKIALSPSRPRKMQAAAASASESAIPGRSRPSSIGGVGLFGPQEKRLQAPHWEYERRRVSPFGVDPVWIGAFFARTIKRTTGKGNHSGLRAEAFRIGKLAGLITRATLSVTRLLSKTTQRRLTLERG